VTMSDAIELIYSTDGSRRIVLFRRADGTFGFREEYHYKNDFDTDNVFEGWASLPPHASFYDSLETARREAIYDVSWQANHK
jgi:hypothetical protein